MNFQIIQSKINIKKIGGAKAKKLIYDYIHKLNKGTKRGTRNFTTQFLTDCSRNIEIIEVYKMSKNEETMERIFVFNFSDRNSRF